MKTVTWDTLLERALPYDEVIEDDVLDQIEEEEVLLVFRKEDGKTKYRIEDAWEVSSVDHHDNQHAIQLTGIGWISKPAYEKGNYVVVHRAVFLETTSDQSPNTGTQQMSQSSAGTMPRRTVIVELFDNDPGLEVEHSLVARYENVVTEDDDNTTIREVLMNHQVDRKIKAHNEKRATQVDRDILNRTGNEVMLLPVKLKDLTWVVR